MNNAFKRLTALRTWRSHIRHTFRALGSRNFRLFFSGQLVSLVGTWMQQIALSWLVYRLTNNPFLLGAVAFLAQGPGFVIAPFAGLLADRYSRQKLLVLTQSLSMLQALSLAVLAFSGHIQIWHILLLSGCMGIITGLDIPVRQSLVPDLLDKPETLSNAISLNSSVFNGARLVGPAIAGVAISTVGESWCFLLNGISYVAVIFAILRMRVPRKANWQNPGSSLNSLKEGFAYVNQHAPMKAILLLMALVSLVGLPYSVVVPVIARDVLHGNAQTLGLLMGGAGAGAVSGAVFLATRTDALGLIRVIPIAAGLFGLTLIGFSQSTTLWLSILMIYGLGIGMMLQLASSNILLQTLVTDNKRGRVMSMYTMAFLGMTPIGSLAVGWLTTHFGHAFTLAFGGVVCFLGALAFASRLSTFKLVPPVREPEPAVEASPTQSVVAGRR